MLGKVISKIAVFALRSKRLSGEQKAFVTSALLDNLVAFPIRDIISFDENGTFKINGRILDTDQKIMFRESAVGMKNSFARKIIHDQMIFRAINVGLHKAINMDSIIFSQAALWVIQEEEKLLSTFTDEV